MKKILIFLTLILIITVSLPILGNKIIEEELSNRVDVLVSYGVEVKESVRDSSYLSTSKYYELKIVDSDKFMTYIQQFSDSQLPPYVNSMIEGVSIGSDVKYSNFPLSDALSVDIYPLTFSDSFNQSVAKEDGEFFKYLENILQTKGILYHINYSVLKSEFDGYIKDIDESYTLKDGTKMSLILKGSTFNGDGLLLAPERIDSEIQSILLDVTRTKENIRLSLDGWTSTSNFASASTFAYGANVNSFKLKADGTVMGSVAMLIDNLHLNLSSDTQDKKAQLYLKSSLENFKVTQSTKKFRLANFNYDIAVKDIDKDSFEKLRVLLVKAKADDSKEMQEKIQASFVEVISKGLEFLIADFSVKKIDFKNEKEIDGFSLKADLILKNDPDLVNNINMNPNAAAQEMRLDSTFRVSKQMFAIIIRELPLAVMAKMYAKEDANDLVYRFRLKDGNLSVNGKALR